MKRCIKWLSSLCLVVVMFCCTGCLFTLNKPILELGDDTFVLTWQEQNNVKHYLVEMNDVEYTIDGNSFDMAPLLTTGIQNIKVKALSDNMFTNDSDWSEVKTLVLGETQLTTPVITAMPQESNSYTLFWESVANADVYSVGIEPEHGQEMFFETDEACLNINEHMSNGGKYTLKVRALSYDYTTYAPSKFCTEVEYVCPLPLVQPTGLKVAGDILSWDAVDNSNKYRITNVDGDSITSTTTSANINQLCTTNKAQYLFVQALSDGTTQDSAYSDAIGIYPTSTTPTMQKQAYANSSFDFLGNSFDLVIDNTNEMKLMCYYTLYYRITNTKFYVNYSTKVADELLRYLSEYNEIKSISYTMHGPVVHSTDVPYELNVEFSHVAMPTKSATGSNNVSQVEEVKPLNYSKLQDGSVAKRDEIFEDFAINNRNDEVLVFTTDQLYYALQEGCKPIFSSTTTMAYKAYEKAKTILREIIDNSMTDYQKVLAIYEWVVYNTHYDSNLLDLSNELEGSRDENVRNSASSTLSNYKGFYIDGVLFDQGQAVCDGIAKTMVLLCNIENIQCIKVSGDAGGAHAWNKVNILVPGQTAKKWFTIDATWADILDSSKKEWLTHRYFLKTDEQMEEHTEDPQSAYNSVTVFDYYSNMILGNNGSKDIDLYIESVAEATTLLNYIIDWNTQNPTNKITGIEFKFSTNLASTIRNTVNTILYNVNHQTVQSGDICLIIFD